MSRAKASPVKRILAKALDILLALGCIEVLPRLLGVLIGLPYLLLSDGIPRGQSLGKMVFGLAVHDQDGGPCDFKSSAFRNIPVALAFLLFNLYLPGTLLLIVAGIPLLAVEVWLMWVDPSGERLGDRIASTVVVETLP